MTRHLLIKTKQKTTIINNSFRYEMPLICDWIAAFHQRTQRCVSGAPRPSAFLTYVCARSQSLYTRLTSLSVLSTSVHWARHNTVRFKGSCVVCYMSQQCPVVRTLGTTSAGSCRVGSCGVEVWVKKLPTPMMLQRDCWHFTQRGISRLHNKA